ncbi:MAG TPA: NUDIX domain-containing protein [Candidatus Nitrosotalea sp.]|nr:NUDIX domain-containing protein [Candidatus Nitrosotalea sp.]
MPDAVVAVVRRGPLVLMIRRGSRVPDPGYWAPPSGKVEHGETQEGAVVREVREEVGITVRPLWKVWESISAGGTHRLHWWLAEAVDGHDLVLDRREVSDARWVTVQEVATLEPTFADDRHFFEQVLERRTLLPDRIHILGSSGSGTTTLAALIAKRYGHRQLDTDDFFWMRTSPPYREKRPVADRLALLRRALVEARRWVLAGSLCGWGDPLIREFELVVLLAVPTPVRLARLRMRAIERYGEQAVAPGGELHDSHVEFLDWAGRYDTGGLEMRSRALHEAWLSALSCPVVRIEGTLSSGEQLAQIEARLGAGLRASARSE